MKISFNKSVVQGMTFEEFESEFKDKLPNVDLKKEFDKLQISKPKKEIPKKSDDK